MKFKLKKDDFEHAMPGDCEQCIFAKALQGDGRIPNVYSASKVEIWDEDAEEVELFEIHPQQRASALIQLFDDYEYKDEECIDQGKLQCMELFGDQEWELVYVPQT